MKLLLYFLLLSLGITFGEYSFYKMRVYKTFLQELFSKNLKLIFSKMDMIHLNDIEIADGAHVTNFNLKIAL